MTLWELAMGSSTKLAMPAPDLGQLDSGNLVVYSPDGKLLATSGSDYYSGDSAIFIWNVASGQLLSPTLTYSPTRVSRLAFDPDGKTMAAGYYDGTIVLWDITSGKILTSTSNTDASRITLLKFILYDSPETTFLVSADGRGKLTWWNTKSGQKEYEQETGVTNTSADLSAKSSQLVFGSQGRDNNIGLTLWSFDGKSTPLNGHAASVTSLAFSPDGQMLVSGDDAGQVILWRMAGDALSSLLAQGDASQVISAAHIHTADGGTLVAVGDDRIKVWTTAAGQMPTVTTVFTMRVPPNATAMALSPNRKTLALGTDTGSVSLWDLDQRRQITEVLTHTDRVNSLTFSPNGREFVLSGADGKLVVWNAVNGKPVLTETLPAKLKRKIYIFKCRCI
jgi:WD40 repeat protein